MDDIAELGERVQAAANRFAGLTRAELTPRNIIAIRWAGDELAQLLDELDRMWVPAITEALLHREEVKRG